MIPFSDACASVGRALEPGFRRKAIAGLSKAADYRTVLSRLGERMRTHVWNAGPLTVNLASMVASYDEMTRRDGFHALHDWDGKADAVTADSIPLDVLNYVAALRGSHPLDPGSLAVLFDYYFLHILTLLSLRVWDAGDPDANLDQLRALLDLLQGADGSGQRFIDDVETLILIATSHFELVEIGYEKLLDRVRTLSPVHQTRIALGHAASMGSHLRFGFEATYGRDTIVMRNDNVADYPWLCFALEVSMREFARLRDAGVPRDQRREVVEKILNGLSADARAFVGEAPQALSASERSRARFLELFVDHRDELMEEFERLQPTGERYSPLSFFFNFSHNILKGTVIDALLRGRPWPVTFNDLLSGAWGSEVSAGARLELATTLMDYARRHPDRIRGRLMPVIVYDPKAGQDYFKATLRKLRD